MSISARQPGLSIVPILMPCWCSQSPLVFARYHFSSQFRLSVFTFFTLEVLQAEQDERLLALLDHARAELERLDLTPY